MGDRPTTGYMKGFTVMCDTGRSTKAQKQQHLLDALENLPTDLSNATEPDLLDDELWIVEEFRKLPHYEKIWLQGSYSSTGMSDQGGGWIGWHWKKEKYWEDFYNPTKEDIKNLKQFVKKLGLQVGEDIEDGIIAFEG